MEQKQAFTCIGRGHSAPCRPATRDDWEKARREPWLTTQCNKIGRMMAEGVSEDIIKGEKARLWVWTPHCAGFRSNHRAAADALKPLNRLMLDFDEKGHTEEIMRCLTPNPEPKGEGEAFTQEGSEMKVGPLTVLLIEESVRHGTHVLVEIPDGMGVSDVQQLMKEATGFTPDAAVKDIARCIYMVPESYTKYVSEKLFNPGSCSVQETAEKTAKPAEPKTTSAPAEPKTTSAPAEPKTTAKPAEPKTTAKPATPAKTFPTTYHGIPVADIIRKYWELNNGGFEPTKGDRDTLTYQLACDLRHICGKSFEWLDQVIPCYDGFTLEEKRQKIRSALNSSYESFPQRLRIVLDSFGKKAGNNSNSAQGSPLPNDKTTQAATLPEMPAKLPKCVELMTSKTPKMYKAAVANAIFPPLATHLCGVRFTYTDNVEHEATLMNVLMAPTGAGKGCIDEPIARAMADIKRRDEENMRREAEWKKDCQRKGANKDKQPRPEGLVIQIIDPDMTKPALVTRMDEAEGHFVYVKLNELDLFEQLKGQTGKQHFQLMCLAFDPGAEYGQTRVGTQSVTARPRCRFNWNACTTILKGRRFFSKVLTDGPVSRINFCTIPEAEIGAEQPVYGKYDAAFDEALRPYINNLNSAHGLVECPQAIRLVKKLQAECAEFARLSQSDVYWNLSHRACVIAWLKACVLYVANGMKWERSIEDFIRWSLNYDLACKMLFFGEDIERACRGNDARIGLRGPQNLLTLLPDEFTVEDARRVRRQQGLSSETADTLKMIRNWKNRDYVTQNSEFSFLKSKYFTNHETAAKLASV